MKMINQIRLLQCLANILKNIGECLKFRMQYPSITKMENFLFVFFLGLNCQFAIAVDAQFADFSKSPKYTDVVATLDSYEGNSVLAKSAIEHFVSTLNSCMSGGADKIEPRYRVETLKFQFGVDSNGHAFNIKQVLSSGIEKLDNTTVDVLDSCDFRTNLEHGNATFETITVNVAWQPNDFRKLLDQCAFYPFPHTNYNSLLPSDEEWAKFYWDARATLYLRVGDQLIEQPVSRNTAELLCRRAEKIIESSVGKEQTLTAYALNNLADLYAAANSFALAEPLYLRSLEILATVFGRDHPFVATQLENMAIFYQHANLLEMARSASDRAARIRATPVKIGDNFKAAASAGNCVLALKSNGTLWYWKEGTASIDDHANTNGPWRSEPRLAGEGFADVRTAGIYPEKFHDLYNIQALKSDGSILAINRDCVQIKEDASIVGGSYGRSVLPAGIFQLQLTTDGNLWAFGDNSVGQLGDGTNTYRVNPVQVGTGYQRVTQAINCVMALKIDGSLWMWGEGMYSCRTPVVGQVGVPRKIGANFRSFALTQSSGFALKSDGVLLAWGYNNAGQLGNGYVESGVRAEYPVEIGADFNDVVASQYHTLALKFDGSVWAWGYINQNWCCQRSGMQHASPERIGEGYSHIAIGEDFAIGIKPDGTLWVWPALWR